MKLALSILATVIGIFAAKTLSAAMFGPPRTSLQDVINPQPMHSPAAAPARYAAQPSKPIRIKVKAYGRSPHDRPRTYGMRPD